MTSVPLDQIVAAGRARSAERRRRMSLDQLVRLIPPDPSRRERVIAALTKPDLAFIAALERASPSGGRMLTEEPGTRSDPTRRAGPRWRAWPRHSATAALMCWSSERSRTTTTANSRTSRASRSPGYR